MNNADPLEPSQCPPHSQEWQSVMAELEAADLHLEAVRVQESMIDMEPSDE